ncbi:Early light-induced protein 1, chloroplastic [Ancistrocladus abbreviatus]
MAMATSMQSLLASPISGLNNRSKLTQMVVPSGFTPRLARNARLRVRCMAEQKDKMASSPNQEDKPEPTPMPTPSPKPKVNSTSFGDVFAFSGPAPERINGRLAMIGFVAAMAVEVSKGSDVFTQISDGGIQWFLGTSVLLSVASLIPLFKGVSAESKSNGLMTSDAELWNGRFAMLGLVALALTEYVKGGALV